MIQDNTQFESQLNNIADIVNKNKAGIIVLPLNPSVDAIASATALYLGLNKAGKNVSLVCSSKPQSDLTGADKIQQALSTGGDNLVISIPYADEGSIDKVDYNIQGKTFNLVVSPKPGYPKLEPDKIHFSYIGGKVEFIFTIDVPSLNNIGPLYQQNQGEFQGKNIINIDRHLINNSYGLVNYVNKSSSSTSELVLNALETLQIEIDKEIATNLYAGLVVATNNFSSYSVNAQTFQTASKLLQLGAVKKPVNRFQQTNRYPGGPFQPPRAPTFAPVNPFQPVNYNNPDNNNYDEQPFQPPPFSPQPASEQQVKPIEDVETINTGKEGQKHNTSDFLKPKIFSRNGLV
ncbi:hypothetical protein A3F03_02175 [Candidatus Roizmanbacteria bacterium RIFCSPHIGHO2_12_FULL_41_11]|uniref:DDH domain-containing protein n=3 Tax=Candidatus Roizmaniibacteriota TaxID=1752723 RepID=A0A1F7JRD9_9BACT|nr:MAG: hypothetical protein A3F03_02175 [Candidatus Roizmanbacteria bacterium RIFCSPHIGHO2_12_FULL_41_11]OGK51884.1 MAG: hypothetical protein A2966_00705 [Candidatus Roizmanbacteria bacterium RIFCSPLOWO2_01_FULL_41_22]OGK58169.1 MAG: hypothetical protein A3H86_00495 [Candidatus Roizmanbacteria bacterium RIFCSPLOWO2_02_FULL_41_9]